MSNSPPDVSIILPTYNEAGNIIKLIDSIKLICEKHLINYQIIHVDDDSPDGTGRLTSKKYKNKKNVEVYIRTQNKGLAAAILMGIQKSTGNTILVMDTDFNHNPQMIPQMLLLAKQADLIIGSRYVNGGGMENRLRNILSFTFNVYIKLLLGQNVNDNLSGFFLIKRKVLLKMPLQQIFYGFGDYFIRLIYFVFKKNYVITEIPVYYKNRVWGASKSKFFNMFFTYTHTALRLREKGRRRVNAAQILLLATVLVGLFLRIYKLGLVPVSLHGDEVGVGYNALSLIWRGIDEYGKSWPMVLRADVAPAIFYATIPSLVLFGSTDFAIRFPSVIIGTILIPFIYLSVKQILLFYMPKVNQKKIALLTSFFTAISPWSIQISRITHDASYGLLLQIVALWLYFVYLNKNRGGYLFLSAAIFGLTFYAYQSPRLTTPLLIVALLIINRIKKGVFLKLYVLAVSIFIITILPITINTFTKPISQTRFGGINIFIKETPHESYLSIPAKFFNNYLSQFNPFLLFVDTSSMRYFNVRLTGLFLPILLPFIFYGLTRSKRNRKLFLFICLWIFIAVLPGALTLGPPNGGRNYMLLPGLCFLAALGLYYLPRKYFLLVTLLITLNFSPFLYFYFVDSPKKFISQWEYGVKEMAQYVTSQENNFDRILVSDSIKQAYVYVLFYGRKDPLWLSNLPNKTKNSFIGYDSFGNYSFKQITPADFSVKNSMIVEPFDRTNSVNAIKIISSPTGEPLFVIVKTE